MNRIIIQSKSDFDYFCTKQVRGCFVSNFMRVGDECIPFWNVEKVKHLLKMDTQSQ